MKDRFRFRVWDKNHKVYFGGDYGVSYYLTDSEIDGDLYCRQCDGPFELSEDDDFIVEQCTGLKDKNGKLIYEGDILKDHNGIWQVLWNEKEAAFYLYNKKRDFYLSPFIGEFEIIGNIHEKESK